MQESTHIGLDVHKETIAVAVLRPGRAASATSASSPNTPEALRRLFARYPDRAALRTCYEAGPDRLRHPAPAQLAGRALRGDRPLADPQAQRRARQDRPHRRPQPRPPAPRRRAHGGARAHRRPRRRCATSCGRARTSRATAASRASGCSSFLLRYGKRYPRAGAAAGACATSSGCGAAASRSPPPRPPSTTWSAPTSVRDAQLAAIERADRGGGALRAARRAGGAPARLPRHRHAHRGDHPHRDLRLPPLPSAAQLHGLHRARAARALQRRAPAARARSPRPATRTCAACSSRPPGPTATGPRCAASWPCARRGCRPSSLAYSWKAQCAPARDLPQAGRAARREQGGGRRRARALRLRLGGDDRAHGRR